MWPTWRAGESCSELIEHLGAAGGEVLMALKDWWTRFCWHCNHVAERDIVSLSAPRWWSCRGRKIHFIWIQCCKCERLKLTRYKALN